MNFVSLNFRNNIKKISGIAIPIAITRIINSANIFIGMLFIASLGTSALAAGAIVTSIYTAILLIGMGILFSASILMGQAMGRKNINAIGPIITNALILAFLIGIIGAILMLNIEPFLLSMKQNPDVVLLAKHYFNYAAFGLCPCLGLVVLNQFVITIGQPKFGMVSTFMTVPFNAILGYCLLFGKFGFPNLGMPGIAIAIVTNFWIAFTSMLIYVLRNPSFETYQLFKKLSLDTRVLKSLLSLGWPISAQFAIELCAYAGAAMMMGQLSLDALAAHQIVIQSSLLAGIIPFSMAQGASILISKEMGQNNLAGVKMITRHGLILVFLISTAIALLFLNYSDAIISFYIHHNDKVNEGHIITIAKLLLSMFALTQLIDCVRNMLGSCLIGLKRSNLSMLVSILSCWVIAIPVSWISIFHLNLGPAGIPIGFQFGFLIGLVISAILFVRLTQNPADESQNINDLSAEAICIHDL